jgi:hypothetical protein
MPEGKKSRGNPHLEVITNGRKIRLQLTLQILTHIKKPQKPDKMSNTHQAHQS